MKIVLAAALLAALISPSRAEDLAGRWGVGGALGADIPVGSKYVTYRNETGLGLGAWVAYGLDRRWTAKLSYDNLDLSGGPARVQPLLANLNYLLCERSDWHPTVRGGLGTAWVSGTTTSGHKNVPAVVLGLGLERFVRSDVSVGAALDYFLAFNGGEVSRETHILRPGLTAAYWFGGSNGGGRAAKPAPAPKPARAAAAAPAPAAKPAPAVRPKTKPKTR